MTTSRTSTSGKAPYLEAGLGLLNMNNAPGTPTPAPRNPQPSILDLEMLDSNHPPFLPTSAQRKPQPTDNYDGRAVPPWIFLYDEREDRPPIEGWYFCRPIDYYTAQERFERKGAIITAEWVMHHRMAIRAQNGSHAADSTAGSDTTVGIRMVHFSDGELLEGMPENYLRNGSRSIPAPKEESKIKDEVRVAEAADVSLEQLKLDVEDLMGELEDRRAKNKSAEDRTNKVLSKLQETYEASYSHSE